MVYAKDENGEILIVAIHQWSPIMHTPFNCSIYSWLFTIKRKLWWYNSIIICWVIGINSKSIKERSWWTFVCVIITKRIIWDIGRRFRYRYCSSSKIVWKVLEYCITITCIIIRNQISIDVWMSIIWMDQKSWIGERWISNQREVYSISFNPLKWNLDSWTWRNWKIRK